MGHCHFRCMDLMASSTWPNTKIELDMNRHWTTKKAVLDYMLLSHCLNIDDPEFGCPFSNDGKGVDAKSILSNHTF